MELYISSLCYVLMWKYVMKIINKMDEKRAGVM